MGGEVVDYNPNDPDGRVIHIHGSQYVMRVDLVRAQLMHVQLGHAIAAAAGGPARRKTAGDPGMLSVKQRNYILWLCDQLSMGGNRDMRLRVVSEILDHDVETLNDLTMAEAGRVIDAMEAMRQRVDAAARQHAGEIPEPAVEPF